MQEYEVWMEGYSATGEHGTHHLIGKVKANSFKEACDIAIKNWCTKRDYKLYWDSKQLTFWGCKCYDNEADAAKNFG